MPKSRNPGYEPGNHWVLCDRCGFAYRASEMRQTWDGLVVCKKDWEPRQPQDLVRVNGDDIIAKGFVRPDQDGSDIEVTYLDPLPTLPTGTFDNDL